MFYFFFESRTNNSDPVVIWLSGGPGCSSSVALFYENGPFTISDDLSLSWNDFGWDKVCWFSLDGTSVFLVTQETYYNLQPSYNSTTISCYAMHMLIYNILITQLLLFR